jgi:hypothetical protein
MNPPIEVKGIGEGRGKGQGPRVLRETGIGINEVDRKRDWRKRKEKGSE